MRTTLDIDQKLLDQVVAITGERNRGRAVNLALAAFVRRQRVQDFVALAGSIDLVDDWHRLEEVEIDKTTPW